MKAKHVLGAFTVAIVLALGIHHQTRAAVLPPQLNILYPSTSAQKYLLNNPYATAAVIEVDWSSFDNGTDTYNFEAADKAIAPWIAAGKKVSLVLWAVSDSGAGQFGNASTPPYIWNELGPSNYVTCTTQAGNQRLPNYLATAWAENYKPAIAALRLHYEGKVDYIRVGLGHGGETIPGATWQTCFPSKWGVTVATWETYLGGMLAYEGSLSGMTWAVGITPMGNPSSTVPDYIAAKASQYGITFGSQGLESSDLKGCATTTANWCELFKEYPKVGHELQTIGLSCPSGSNCPGNNGLTGPLPPLLTYAKANGATIIEIYADDWLLAFDPQYSGYAKYGASYANSIKTAAQ